MGTKLGIGIVTYERPEFFTRCIRSIPDGAGTVVVVNDGSPYAASLYPSLVNEVVQHTENRCVGVSKNEALRYLLQEGCDYLFLIEDDMELLRPDVFETYIRAAEVSGVWHLNYGPGSPLNRQQSPDARRSGDRNLLAQDTPPEPKGVIGYDHGVQLALYRHTVAMFSFFGREVLEAVGLHDEGYVNAWEHVDLTYRIIKAGMHPPFWWFADIGDSTAYLREQKGAIENSSIARDRRQWEQCMVAGAEHYREVHGHYPNQVPIASEAEVREALRDIKARYARS